MTQTPRKSMTEQVWFGMLLTVVGGMMDAYSFLVRGGVFATGQTGNFVILAISLVTGDHARAGRALVPIAGFWIGIFVSRHILHLLQTKGGRTERADRHRAWKRNILIAEALFLLIVGLIPDSMLDVLPNSLISFAAALQFCSFRHFDGSSAFASVFVTGNMRSTAEKYYEGLVLRDRASLKKALEYTGILAAFFAGAILTVFLVPHLGTRTLWPGAVLLLLLAAVISRPGR